VGCEPITWLIVVRNAELEPLLYMMDYNVGFNTDGLYTSFYLLLMHLDLREKTKQVGKCQWSLFLLLDFDPRKMEIPRQCLLQLTLQCGQNQNTAIWTAQVVTCKGGCLLPWSWGSTHWKVTFGDTDLWADKLQKELSAWALGSGLSALKISKYLLTAILNSSNSATFKWHVICIVIFWKK
jgi:hypothetical protein